MQTPAITGLIYPHIARWAIAACIAFMMSAAIHLDGIDGPSDAQAEWDQSAALQDAIKTEAAKARFTKAIAAICGENGVATDLGDGVVQCRTKHGHATKQVRM